MRSQDGFVDGQFSWFTGVVEDRFDPEELNRVRVRCFGYHSENRADLETEDLPWATVMMPTTSSGTSGIGDTPHGLMEGSWVVGFFRDGPSAQDPIIMGTIASQASSRDKALGFTGDNLPKGEYVGQSDVNFSARNSKYQNGASVLERNKEDYPAINTASPAKISTVADDKSDSYYETQTWTELKALNGHEPDYPYNKVYESEGGHITEIDDTPGFERTHRMHTSGSYEEIYNNGTRQVKIVGDDYEIIVNNKNIHIKGNMNMTIDGDLRQLVYGNYHLEVEKDMTMNIKGSLQQGIQGNHEAEIARNRSVNIGNNDNLLINNDLITNVVNDNLMTISNDYVINTAKNYSNTSYENMNLFAGGKYSQSSVGDYAVASNGNMKFGTTGNLTEEIDGTHTLTCAEADITYDAGELTVNTITHTQHTHVEVPGTGGASSPTPGTQSTTPPEANT
jgi:hypothetical protein